MEKENKFNFRAWFENDQRRPLFLRYTTAFLFGIVALLLVLIFLPAKGPLSGAQKTISIISLVLVFVMSISVTADMNKSRFAIILFPFIFIGALLYYIIFYSGIEFEALKTIFFNMEVMEGQWGLLASGLGVTLHISAYAILLGIGLGLVITVLRQLNNKVITAICVAYLSFFRILPPIVFLFFVYFGLPYAKIVWSPVFCSVVALGMSEAAFISEIFRGGIEAIHRSQIEASRALGMSFFQTMRLVVLPQAVKVVVPTLANECVGIIKDTAICSMISITDLLKAGQIINNSKANPTSLIMAAGIFLIILLPLTIIVNNMEKAQKNRQAKAN